MIPVIDARELVTAPAVEPITVDEAKDHLRLFVNEDDALISSLITAARQRAELFTNRALVTQSWKIYLDCFFPRIELPFAPLQSVTLIDYVDVDGATQTVASSVYKVVTATTPGFVEEDYNEDWPSIRAQTHAVSITFVAGYGIASAVPEAIKQAIRLTVGHFYENREEETVGQGFTSSSLKTGVEALLSPYRVLTL